MTTPTQGEHAQTALAHELFAAAQLAPGEGIEDAVSRIAAALTAAPHPPRVSPEMVDSLERASDTLERLKALGSRVKHLDDTTAQPAAPQGAAYAELPEPSYEESGASENYRPASYSEYDLRDFADRTHALRASHGQAPAGAPPLTDEQIEEIAKQFITRVGSHWEHDDAIPDNGRIEDFVRAIEHAHGIKGADHD